MQPSSRSRSGFLLLEALVGIGVFAIFIAAVGTSMLYGQENTIMAGDRTRAASISQRALEAVRSVRDSSFSSVAPGTYGVTVGASGTWTLVPTPQNVTGSYVTTVTITQTAADVRAVTARTVWKHGYARSGAVLLATELANWRTTVPRGNWSTLTLDGSYVPGGTANFSRAAIGSGNILYVASANTTGLYLLNITNTTAPARIAASFALGVAAYDLIVRGERLYLLTADPNAELQVYDISNPASLSAAQLLTSYNLPGSARGRSLALTDEVLLLGATQNGTAGHDEWYAFEVSHTGSLVLTSSLNDLGDILALAVSGSGAFAATSIDTGELRIAQVYDSGSIVFPVTASYNLADRTLDGVSVAATGSGVLLGTMKGAIQEMVLFTVHGGSVTTPGPWYHEGSGSLLGVAMDPSRCIGFLAADSGRKALQTVNIRATASLPELTSHDSVNGKGRGVLYDPVRDRAFLLTEQAVLIFRPGVSTGTCP